jgi:hypothetical protein
MTRSGKTAPPAPDPKPGRNPGYAEPLPRDKEDAEQPHPRHMPDPDAGGLQRDPAPTPDPADE